MWGLSIIIHKVPFMLGHYSTVYILFIVIKNGVLYINYYVGISGIMFWQSQRVLKYLTQNKLKSHCKLLTFSKSAVYKKRSSLGSCLDASRVMAIFVYSGDRKPIESLFLYIYPLLLVDRVVHITICEFGWHCFKRWFIAHSAKKHDLHRCLNITVGLDWIEFVSKYT